MNTKADTLTTQKQPEVEPEGQESYIVTEGKKRGATRDVRTEAAYDRFYTVLRVHPGDAILTDNWHTNQVLDHARNNFEGVTFAMHAGSLGRDDRKRSPRLLHSRRPNLDDGSGTFGRQKEAAARHGPCGQEIICPASC